MTVDDPVWPFRFFAESSITVKESPRFAPYSAHRPAFPPFTRPCRELAPQRPQKRKKAAGFLLPPVRGEVLPHRKAVKPPLLVPVLRNGLGGNPCNGHPLGLRSGEDRFHDVGREVVQGKDSCDV